MKRFNMIAKFFSAIVMSMLVMANSHASSTWQWTCDRSDAAETGFKSFNEAQASAKVHLASHPGHTTEVTALTYKATQNSLSVNAKDWALLSAAQRQDIDSGLRASGLLKAHASIMP